VDDARRPSFLTERNLQRIIMKIKEGVLFRTKFGVHTDNIEEEKTFYKFVPNIRKDDETALGYVLSIDNLEIKGASTVLETHNGNLLYVMDVFHNPDLFSQRDFHIKTKDQVERMVETYGHMYRKNFTTHEQAEIYDAILLKDGSFISFSQTESLVGLVRGGHLEEFLTQFDTYQEKVNEKTWYGALKFPNLYDEYKDKFNKAFVLVENADKRIKKDKEEAIKENMKLIDPDYRKKNASETETQYNELIKKLKADGWSEKVLLTTTTKRKTT
jgi:hypothetical protein